MYVEKNHYKDLNIGDKSEDIQIRKRKIESTFKSVHLSLLSKIEINFFEESWTNQHLGIVSKLLGIKNETW